MNRILAEFLKRLGQHAAGDTEPVRTAPLQAAAVRPSPRAPLEVNELPRRRLRRSKLDEAMYDKRGRRLVALRADTANPGLPDLVYGYPARGGRASVPVEFVDCKIYYGTYGDFTREQRQYYLWWRERFMAGENIQAVDTYLFIAAYEIAIFAETIDEVIEWWSRLWHSYSEARSFRGYCARWINDARALGGYATFDEISLSMQSPSDQFDAAVRAHISPSAETVLALTQRRFDRADRPRILATIDAMREESGRDRILAAAQSLARAKKGAQAFNAYPTAEFLWRLYPPGTPTFIPSWHDRPAVRKATIATVNDAAAFWGLTLEGAQSAKADAGADLVFSETLTSLKQVPIRRSVDTKKASDAETIEGLKRTLTLMGDKHCVLLFALVLHVTDVKPYVEGQITYSTEMRNWYEKLSYILGLETGLRPFRDSFHRLGHGIRGPWTLEPAGPTNEMKMNVVRARFKRGLQRELLGSTPRGELYRWLCDRTTLGSNLTRSDVHAALESATGVSSFVGSLV